MVRPSTAPPPPPSHPHTNFNPPPPSTAPPSNTNIVDKPKLVNQNVNNMSMNLVGVNDRVNSTSISSNNLKLKPSDRPVTPPPRYYNNCDAMTGGIAGGNPNSSSLLYEQ